MNAKWFDDDKVVTCYAHTETGKTIKDDCARQSLNSSCSRL